jgi:hypothetical protein
MRVHSAVPGPVAIQDQTLDCFRPAAPVVIVEDRELLRQTKRHQAMVNRPIRLLLRVANWTNHLQTEIGLFHFEWSANADRPSPL